MGQPIMLEKDSQYGYLTFLNEYKTFPRYNRPYIRHGKFHCSMCDSIAYIPVPIVYCGYQKSCGCRSVVGKEYKIQRNILGDDYGFYFVLHRAKKGHKDRQLDCEFNLIWQDIKDVWLSQN